MANNTEGSTILDAIMEKAINIESTTNAGSTRQIIKDSLKQIALKERAQRESTITFRTSKEMTSAEITEIIEQEWVARREQAPVTHWADKEHAYAQFINQAVKQVFVESALRQKEKDGKLYHLVKLAKGPDDSGYHYQRKEIRIEITGARPTIIPSIIEQSLNRIARRDGTVISPIREGKLHGPAGRQTRSLMFKVNSGGFNVIYDKLGGIIPYTRLETTTKIRLYPRINARPWSCRDCFYVGPNHQCNGKTCAQCGAKGHLTKECKSTTRYCTNCKKRGHRAKDLHCPMYLREVIKEIQKMDIPLEFLEEEEKRSQLVKALILK